METSTSTTCLHARDRRLGPPQRRGPQAGLLAPRVCLAVGPADRAALVRLSRSHTVAHRVVRRARIVLMGVDGHPCAQIAAQLHVSRPTVRLWCRRYLEGGIEALLRDRPGRGRKKKAGASGPAHAASS